MLMTLNEWLKKYGYQWAEGREQMYKAAIEESQAQEIIGSLRRSGAIKRA
jgi:hypothetical protein